MWVTYVPSEGTRVRLDGEVVLHDRGKGLLQAVLDLWLGPTPVSEEVEEELRNQLGRG